MEAGIEPQFIKKNGEPNPLWIKWHMTTIGCDENKARYDWWVKVRAMDEPALMTDKEKPNPIWVAWWRGHKGCSNNVALNTCKAKIAGTWMPNKRAVEWLEQKKTKRHLKELD